MIAISSLRPFSDIPSEHNTNQREAWASWQEAFHSIIYLNHPEPDLESDRTRFLPWEPFPMIRDMARIASGIGGWVCIINADIVVSPKLPFVEGILNQKGACCASSWRWEFYPSVGVQSGRIVDSGLDFFAANQEMWKKVARVCPEKLRSGTQFWDTWMLSFFNAVGQGGFYNITASRCIFHPKHGNRKYGPGFDHREIQVIGRPIMSSNVVRV